jgi:hypothetical protein
MASAERERPTCPVCNRSDQVKTTQAAYNSGVALAAPPDLPTRQISMMPYVGAGMVLVGIFVFLVLVFIGGLENNLPSYFMWPIVVLTIASIITALVVSYIAFQRIVRGDNEVALHYPAYDQAMNTWRGLYYCSHDNIVFDPKSHKALSKEQITNLRAFAPKTQQGQHPIAISH